MDLNKNNVKDELSRMLGEKNIDIGRSAVAPLKKISFKNLVAVFDHEEDYLRNTFLKLLLAAHAARVIDRPSDSNVTATDVRTALLMLGQAAALAPEEQFSNESKKSLKDACPYCKEP